MFANRRFLIIFLAILFSISCENSHQQSFKLLSKAFLDWYYRNNPVYSTWLGIHDYDDKFGKYTSEAAEQEYEDVNRFLIELDQIDHTKLKQNDKIDYFILKNSMNKLQFDFKEMKSSEWNPMVVPWVIGDGLSSLTDRNFEPVEKRTINLIKRMQEIPRVVNEMQNQISDAPEIYTKTAIKQMNGVLSMLDDIPSLLTANSSIMDTLDVYIQKSRTVLANYKRWLEEDLLPRSNTDFRIGKNLYFEKFKFIINEDVSPESVLKSAYKALKNTQRKMFEIALPIYLLENDEPVWVSKEDTLDVIVWLLNDIADNHGLRNHVVDNARNTIKELEEFINDNHLLKLDKTQPLQLRETPEYQRGVAIAGLDAPGPFEKKLNTFYNVSPIPEDWTDEQAESFLREYNNISLKILSIHESLPGHYVQLYHAREHPSEIRAVFGSGVMIEGWAHYCEGMMVDAGFGGGDARYKLVQLKWALRGITNAIIDQEIHAGIMTKDEAITLMTEEGFQEESEAEGKWVRAQLTSCQLSTYFIGTMEMWRLRRDMENELGKKFNLKSYHEEILSYGSIPIKYIRELLLDN